MRRTIVRETQVLGPDNAIWDDGEWVSWDHINSELARMELRERYPLADLNLLSTFNDLLQLAEQYHLVTGRHLQVYGELGELFAAVTYGIQLHRPYAPGSDGRSGKELVEVKTISPMKRKLSVTIDLKGNFSRVVVVRIDPEFEVSARTIARAKLPKSSTGRVNLRWDAMPQV